MSTKTDNEAQYEDDVQHANILRALDLMIKSWDEPETSISDMTHQINECCKVVAGECNCNDFAQTTNLASLERLN